jgi:hypothetical protein
MTLQEHIKTPADLPRTLATLAFGASLALAAWAASGVLAGPSQAQTQSSAVGDAASAVSCQTTAAPAADAPVQQAGSRRY